MRDAVVLVIPMSMFITFTWQWPSRSSRGLGGPAPARVAGGGARAGPAKSESLRDPGSAEPGRRWRCSQPRFAHFRLPLGQVVVRPARPRVGAGGTSSRALAPWRSSGARCGTLCRQRPTAPAHDSARAVRDRCGSAPLCSSLGSTLTPHQATRSATNATPLPPLLALGGPARVVVVLAIAPLNNACPAAAIGRNRQRRGALTASC